MAPQREGRTAVLVLALLEVLRDVHVREARRVQIGRAAYELRQDRSQLVDHDLITRSDISSNHLQIRKSGGGTWLNLRVACGGSLGV